MNDAKFCSIRVDSSLPCYVLALLVAELTGGVMVRGGVELAVVKLDRTGFQLGSRAAARAPPTSRSAT